MSDGTSAGVNTGAKDKKEQEAPGGHQKEVVFIFNLNLPERPLPHDLSDLTEPDEENRRQLLINAVASNDPLLMGEYMRGRRLDFETLPEPIRNEVEVGIRQIYREADATRLKRDRRAHRADIRGRDATAPNREMAEEEVRDHIPPRELSIFQTLHAVAIISMLSPRREQAGNASSDFRSLDSGISDSIVSLLLRRRIPEIWSTLIRARCLDDYLKAVGIDDLDPHTLQAVIQHDQDPLDLIGGRAVKGLIDLITFLKTERRDLSSDDVADIVHDYGLKPNPKEYFLAVEEAARAKEARRHAAQAQSQVKPNQSDTKEADQLQHAAPSGELSEREQAVFDLLKTTDYARSLKQRDLRKAARQISRIANTVGIDTLREIIKDATGLNEVKETLRGNAAITSEPGIEIADPTPPEIEPGEQIIPKPTQEASPPDPMRRTRSELDRLLSQYGMLTFMEFKNILEGSFNCTLENTKGGHKKFVRRQTIGEETHTYSIAVSSNYYSDRKPLWARVIIETLEPLKVPLSDFTSALAKYRGESETTENPVN